MSPSGHIGCAFEAPLTATGTPGGDWGVRCDVNDAAWKVIVPKNCHGGYGDSVDLGRRTAALDCHGDTVIGSVPHQRQLPYGGTARFHDLTCMSAVAGMTCRNSAGHGFVVSSETYRLF